VGLAVGVDIGGTKIAAGVVDDEGNVLAELRRPTPAGNANETAEVIADVIRQLRTTHEVTAVGVGAAGYIIDRSIVGFSANLPGWLDEPLRDRVSKRIGLPVVLENDANAAGWAEARFGAGRGENHLMLVTVGTGIGGAIVLDGRLYRGRWGIAGEPGHMIVLAGGELCGCGNRGCWERYCSGTALVREARRRAARSPYEARDLLSRAGGSVEGITGPLVTESAKEGDPLAVELLTEIGRWLGVGIANLAALLDPGLFVVGGGLIAAGELLLGPARTEYAATLTGRGHRPLAEVRPAQLGNTAGIVGAADLARRPA
jgi:glucokinase